MQRILVQPKITEKSMRAAGTGVFTFEVAPHAGKNAIKAAVEEAFKVKVLRVSVLTRVVPARRTGSRRLKVAVPAKKFASVKLAKGQSITLFDLKETN